MPKARYTDRELGLLAKAADALEGVMDACGYRDLLYGKWSLLKSDIADEQAARDKERDGMFVPPQRQIVDLMRWNAKRGWGFSDDDLRDIEREIPAAPEAPPEGELQLKARVLEVRLPDKDGTPGLRRTWDELAAVAREQSGLTACHLLAADKATLAPMPGGSYAAGLSWRVIDFGAHWPPDPRCLKMCGVSPHSLGERSRFPGIGLLSAMAHFPLWLKRMDGVHVPYVWLAGCRFEGVPHSIGAMREPVTHHPMLSRNGPDGAPFLYYGWDYVPFDRYAVPIYADAKTDP